MAPLYSATKHAVIGLVRSLARPLLKEQVQINALAPAVIRTSHLSSLLLRGYGLFIGECMLTVGGRNQYRA